MLRAAVGIISRSVRPVYVPVQPSHAHGGPSCEDAPLFVLRQRFMNMLMVARNDCYHDSHLYSNLNYLIKHSNQHTTKAFLYIGRVLLSKWYLGTAPTLEESMKHMIEAEINKHYGHQLKALGDRKVHLITEYIKQCEDPKQNKTATKQLIERLVVLEGLGEDRFQLLTTDVTKI